MVRMMMNSTCSFLQGFYRNGKFVFSFKVCAVCPINEPHLSIPRVSHCAVCLPVCGLHCG